MSVYSQPFMVVRYSSYFLIALALGACNKTPQDAAPQGMPAMPPPDVAVITVKAQNTPVHFEYTAQVAASKEAEIRARVSGILLKKRYQEGQAIQCRSALVCIRFGKLRSGGQ
jgi:membrane fusion protein (multidrug efflux system)